MLLQVNNNTTRKLFFIIKRQLKRFINNNSWWKWTANISIIIYNKQNCEKLRFICKCKLNRFIDSIAIRCNNTGQQPKLSWNKDSCFHIIFGRWVRIRHPFFPSRQNFPVLAISWLPGLKISFWRFLKKLWEISKI